MRRSALISSFIFVLIAVFIFQYSGSVAWPIQKSAKDQAQDKGRDKRMGYCFDSAFDPVQNRLFVVAGYDGMHVFDLSEGKLEFVTTFYDEGYFRNIKISGDRAYIADPFRGLIVFDISKKIPFLTWKWKEPETKTRGGGVFIKDNLAYLAVGIVKEEKNQRVKPGLYVFDISKPDFPKKVGYCKTHDAWDVWVSGEHAYIADLYEGLRVIDISSSSNPSEVGEVTWDEKFPCAEILRSERNYVYIAAGPTCGLVVIDVQDPSKPRIADKFKSVEGACGEGLSVRDGWVYLANGNPKNPEDNGLFIIDARQPESLSVIGRCIFPGWVEGVCLVDNYAFVTNTGLGIRSIDISDPKNPRIVDHYGPEKKRGKK